MAKEPTPMPKSYEKFPLRNPLTAAPPPKKQQYHFGTNDPQYFPMIDPNWTRKMEEFAELEEVLREMVKDCPKCYGVGATWNGQEFTIFDRSEEEKAKFQKPCSYCGKARKLLDM
jgi:hypothetical protein